MYTKIVKYVKIPPCSSDDCVICWWSDGVVLTCCHQIHQIYFPCFIYLINFLLSKLLYSFFTVGFFFFRHCMSYLTQVSCSYFTQLFLWLLTTLYRIDMSNTAMVFVFLPFEMSIPKEDLLTSVQYEVKKRLVIIAPLCSTAVGGQKSCVLLSLGLSDVCVYNLFLDEDLEHATIVRNFDWRRKLVCNTIWRGE